MALGNVLVVEDEPQVADMLREVLVDCGYGALCVGSALDALREVRAYEPDIILLDHYLPDMTGVELLGLLRREHPKTPVVMVTANADQQTALRSLNLGAFDYMPKPFNVEALERILHAAMVFRGR